MYSWMTFTLCSFDWQFPPPNDDARMKKVAGFVNPLIRPPKICECNITRSARACIQILTVDTDFKIFQIAECVTCIIDIIMQGTRQTETSCEMQSTMTG